MVRYFLNYKPATVGNMCFKTQFLDIVTLSTGTEIWIILIIRILEHYLVITSVKYYKYNGVIFIFRPKTAILRITPHLG